MAAMPALGMVVVMALAGCLASLDTVQAPDDYEPLSPPVLRVQQDERDDRLVMTAVGAGFEWSTLALRADPAGTRVTTGGADDGPPLDLVPTEFRTATSSTELVFAGDFLDFCSAERAAGPVTYAIQDTESGQVLVTGTFETLAACE